MTTLPQEGDTSQLPQRGDVLDLEMDGEAPRSVQLLACDSEWGVWTVRDAESGELLLLRIHEDLSWHYVTIEESHDATVQP